MKLTGIHHITAITSDAKKNLDFYTNTLGLRLVKRTVNFDDPSTYHFYYADDDGSPGSVLTFFAWTHSNRGRVGKGQASSIAFAVDPLSLGFWGDRLRGHGVAISAASNAFGENLLAFADPDGLPLELVGASPTTREPARLKARPEIAAEHSIRRFHGVTLAVEKGEATVSFIQNVMGGQLQKEVGARTRLQFPSDQPNAFVDVLADPSMPLGTPGAGTIHHVAFRTPSDESESLARTELLARNVSVSPIIDRTYFHSIYFPEPNRILFEIATDTPGFAVDEPKELLGKSLMLPSRYEIHRAEIETLLPSLQ